MALKRYILNICYCKLLFILLFTMFIFNNLFAQKSSTENSNCSEIYKQIVEVDLSTTTKNYEQLESELIVLIDFASQDSCIKALIEGYRLQSKLNLAQGSIENSMVSSLNALAIAEKHEQKKVIPSIYIDMADAYFENSIYPKAAEYYKLAYKANEELKDYSLSAYLLENMGISYYSSSNLNDSKTAYKTLIENAETLNIEDSQKIRALHKLIIIDKESENFKSALSSANSLLSIMQNADDSLGQVIAHNNIGYLYFMLNGFDEALYSFKQALDIAKLQKVNNSLMANLYCNIGVCYQNLNTYTNAIASINSALAFLDPNKKPDQYAETLNTLAWIYFKKGDLYNASKRSKESIVWAKKALNPIILAECYKTYSTLLKAGNDPIAALEFYELYSHLRDSVALVERIEENSADDLLAQFEKAEKEQKLYIADREMQELMLKQLRLESERRKQEILILKREKEMQQLESEKAYQSLELVKREQEAALQKSTIKNLEQANEIKEFQIKQNEAEEKQRKREIELLQIEKERQQLVIEKEKEIRKRAIWMLVLSFLVLALVIFGLFTTRKKNRLLAKQKQVIEQKNTKLEQANKDILEKNYQLSELAEEIRAQNEEITTQKELIEDKNKSITDSIQYASLIQSAVLPSIDELAQCFSDSFILYKPRDIVSGDFWWFLKTQNRAILAVADCTGHGVPGAFLSMLGSTLLSEIGTQYPNITSSKLLDELQARMVNALVHDKRAKPQRDGMDIAVCIFNDNSNEVEFTGANNPLYILRNQEVIVFKADKMPIGLREGKSASKRFTLNTINYLPNDRFIMFSDGYADQFGGEGNRKLMYKNFRNLLVESSNLPMDKQKEFLDKSFAEWQGYNQQVDDVIVVGVQV